MPRNVEIKARLRDSAFVVEQLQLLHAVGPTVLRQTDVFFKTSNGRLKLRMIDAGTPHATAELIYYDRPDSADAKTSDYVIAPTPDPRSLREALSRAHGERGVVEKTRTLYLVDQTRIHLDSVAGLGEFLELEVVLGDADSVEQGRRIAGELLQRFGIGSEDRMSGAYLDLLAE